MLWVMIRPAQPLDAGAVGRILSEFADTTDWMPRLHSRAEDISLAGSMIDRGWVHVFERDTILGFIARDSEEICALYVARNMRGKGIGKAFLENAKQDTQRLELWTFQSNLRAQKFYMREGFNEVEHSDGQRNEEKLPAIKFLWTKAPMHWLY